MREFPSETEALLVFALSILVTYIIISFLLCLSVHDDAIILLLNFRDYYKIKNADIRTNHSLCSG